MYSKINQETGYPMAKFSSIQRTKEVLSTIQNPRNINFGKYEKNGFIKHCQEFGNNAINMTIERYGSSLYLYQCTLGELKYKQGLWDEAEKLWLPLLMANTTPCEFLAKMYHHEHRYGDEILILKLGISAWNTSPFNVYHGAPTELERRLNKALKAKDHHTNKDISKGFKYIPFEFDEEFLSKLNSLRK